MKEGHFEEIKNHAYWEVIYRPLGRITPIRLVDAKTTVQKSAVSIRGWDFPHISFRNDDEGGEDFTADYYQNWTDWQGFHEILRVFKSRQFYYACVVHEDTGFWEDEAKVGETILYIPTIYAIFEYVEFAHRLAKSNFYSDGLLIRISLKNARNRTLSAGRGRVPFFDRFRFAGPELEVEKLLSQSQMLNNHKEEAISTCLDFFDFFGFAPDQNQLRSDQESFYQKQFR